MRDIISVVYRKRILFFDKGFRSIKHKIPDIKCSLKLNKRLVCKLI